MKYEMLERSLLYQRLSLIIIFVLYNYFMLRISGIKHERNYSSQVVNKIFFRLVGAYLQLFRQKEKNIGSKN